jgi:hypothetical protein
MTDTRNEYFDSESLLRMRAALDAAWGTLPAAQQIPETKTALAKAILHLAAEGELDPARLSHLALAAIAAGAQHDFEVLDGDETISFVRSLIDRPHALWPRIVEIAKTHPPGRRIRVTDQSGATVILVGVATALRLEGVALSGSG